MFRFPLRSAFALIASVTLTLVTIQQTASIPLSALSAVTADARIA